MLRKILRAISSLRAAPPERARAKLSGSALEQSERNFRLLVESVQDFAIFMLDPEGHIVSWNRGAERMKGYAAEEVLGEHVSIFYTEADRKLDHPAEELRIALREGRYAEEGWRVRKNGSRFLAGVTITAVRDEERRLVGFGKVTRDLTEKRAAATAVQESEERFRSLAENASDAIVTIDTHDRIVFANRAVEKLFGYTAEELADIPFTALMPEPFRDRHRAGMRRHIATGERHIRWDGVELPGLHKSGHEVPLEITFGEYRRRGEHFFSGIMRDVTGRKRIEEERERVVRVERSAKELAERAVRAREQVLGIVAHDLRSPLNAISSSARLLQMLPPDERRDKEGELLQAIVRSADRMDRLISDLLDVSRIEAGRFSLVRKSVDPATLVKEICRILGPRAEEESIELRWERAEHSPPPISADEDRLLQVLENLVGNAIKFTPDGGRITLRAEPEGSEMVRFRVCDTGPGIPQDDLEHVFDAYWHQAERSDGAGLGLFISRGIVEAHGGRIWAESEPGEGSTFRFTIPVAGAE